MPFADNAGGVARALEHGCHCRPPWLDDELCVAGQDAGALLAPGILAGEEGIGATAPRESGVALHLPPQGLAGGTSLPAILSANALPRCAKLQVIGL
jgi:hypothetical protein